MNQVFETLLRRKSVRAYEPTPLSDEAREAILGAAMRAPTAGNLMLYSIIEVSDQVAKETLARTCDNQPFIAGAPLVLLFLADYQRWYDYYRVSGVPEMCAREGRAMRRPAEGDLLLACCDALIAAQTAVIAAESLGIGSCYIGDIMENYETHQDLFALPPYALPICLLCIGHPTAQQRERPQTSRFGREFIVFRDRYHRLEEAEFRAMFAAAEAEAREGRGAGGELSVGQRVFERKFDADFAKEMNRSVRAMLERWRRGMGDGRWAMGEGEGF